MIINLAMNDVRMLKPVAGMPRKSVGTATVFYRASCVELSCHFTFVQAADAALARRVAQDGGYEREFMVGGVDEGSLARALKSIKFRVLGAKTVEEVPLADFLDQAHGR